MNKIRPSESLRRAYQGLNSSLSESKTPLSMPQASVLRALLQQGPLNQTMLVAASGVDRSTLSDMLVRLAGLGHIVAARRPEDKRASLVLLTPGGRAALLKAESALGTAEAAMMRKVPSADRAAFLRGLRALAGALS